MAPDLAVIASSSKGRERRRFRVAKGLAFPAIPEDHVWLFHGTTRDNALAIAKNGWAPPEPWADARALAESRGVDPDQKNGFVDHYAKMRHERGRVRSTCTWLERRTQKRALRSPTSLTPS